MVPNLQNKTKINMNIYLYIFYLIYKVKHIMLKNNKQILHFFHEKGKKENIDKLIRENKQKK